MIKLNPNKTKTLTFDISVTGIDPSLLEYNLRFTENGIDYGFAGVNKNGEVKVIIPPLSSIIQEDRINEIKKVRLEIHDSSNKYFMMPYEDTVVIEREPTFSISLKEEEEEIMESKIAVHIKEDVDTIIEKKTDKPKTKSKLSKFLG